MTVNDNKDNINNNLNEETDNLSKDINSEIPDLFSNIEKEDTELVSNDINEPNLEVNKSEENVSDDKAKDSSVGNLQEEKLNEEKPINENLPEEKEPKEELPPAKIQAKESNYQISLVDENILKIKVSTNKSVSIDCSVRDKSSQNTSSETQSNKILIHPKSGDGKQEIEIFVKIGADGNIQVITESESQELHPEKKKIEQTSERRLTPNPIVADLITRFSKPKETVFEKDFSDKTPEERLEEKLGRKNPWKLYKNILLTNLKRGFIAANIIVFVSVMIFYAVFSKQKKEDEVIEQKRLIVMQDLPENLNQQNQLIDDPNKPEPPKEETSTNGSDIVPPIITPKKFKPPRIITPKFNPNTNTSNDTNISKINNELDSLRNKKYVGNNGNNTGKGDTGAVNTSLLPDSLLKNLSGNEVGLTGKFPPNWKQIDSRDINPDKKEFDGVILVDTTAKKKEEALNMYIQLDSKGEMWKQFQFKKLFEEDSLRSIFSIEPKPEGKKTYYRFYVASKVENIFIASYVETASFEKYKAEIERVVKTIRIVKPQ